MAPIAIVGRSSVRSYVGLLRAEVWSPEIAKQALLCVNDRADACYCRVRAQIRKADSKEAGHSSVDLS